MRISKLSSNSFLAFFVMLAPFLVPVASAKDDIDKTNEEKESGVDLAVKQTERIS